MATNKVYPRVLSKSGDARLRKKTEMLDALNVRAYESNDEFFASGDGDSNPSGNEGVLKPVKGNELVEITSAINEPEEGGTGGSGYTVIGSVSDEARSHIYYFVWHSTSERHAVLRYTDDGDGTLEKVIQTKWLNFYANSVVQGSVTHVSSSEYGQGTGEKTFLYFTDNYNEPRCLDINACLTVSLNDLEDREIVEFISLCPITPTRPILFEWGYDPSVSISNFKNSRGVQFAYQNVFKNGTVSAFSVYSKLAVNPAYLSQGADPTPEIDAYNFIKVRIPVQSENVESIRLYGREGNQGPWFFIDDFRESETAVGSSWYGPQVGYYTTLTDGTSAVPVTFNTYKYYNNSVVSYVPEDITFKQFDSVPKLAEAIALSNDRLFMGNYVEGFDKVDVSAAISYVSRSRPEDFLSLDINMFSEVREIGTQGGVKNRISGFRLDMSNAPGTLDPGTTLNINITVNPESNIHLYQSKDSFHASVFTTFNDPNDDSLLQDQVTDAAQQSSSDFNPALQCAGTVSSQTRTVLSRTFTVKDIGFDPLASVAGTSQNKASASWSSTDGQVDVAYGTSASNPLIIQGKPMSFFIRLFINNPISKADLSDIIAEALSGKEIIPPRAGDPGPGQIVSADVSVLDVKSTAGYQVNCGLGDLDYINTGDSNSRKICFVVQRDLAETASGLQGVPPCGYFILNRADVVFGLNRVSGNNLVFDSSRKYAEGTYEDIINGDDPTTAQTDDVFFSLDLKSIGNEEVLTCLPDMKGGYMHTANVAVSNAYMRNSDRFTNSDLDITGGTNTIDRWVCISQSTAYRLRTGSVSPSETLGRFGRPECRNDVSSIIDGSYQGGQFADQGVSTSLEFLTTGFDVVDSSISNADVSTNDVIIQQIKRLVGFLKFPGRSVSSSVLDPDVAIRTVGSSASIIDDVQFGSIACTRDRIIGELNRQFQAGLNPVDNAQSVIINLLGYTLVDGESGPGSNTAIGSVNSTMVRDGLLYHYAGQGLSPGPAKGFYIEILEPLNLETLINGNFTTGGNANLGVNSPNGTPLALGYFINVFDNYMPYLDIAEVNPTTVQTTNLNESIETYDGQLDTDIRLVGENVTVEIEGADGEPLLTIAEGVYKIVNPLGWYRQFSPNVEITLQQSFIQQSSAEAADRKTFKSNANHSFGIVYSDFYGRQSSVFPLGSAFVPPYEQQASGNGGAVDMQINLLHDPPDWAHSYQIVYGGNTSYNKFIQYSAGGAFVLPSVAEELDDQGSVSTGNIYVSLNYLQENGDVSYAKAFGARPSDGSDRFYEYRSGDKLRIISYYEGGTRKFANNYVFDVVGTATLGDENNPLHPFDEADPVPNFKKGSFVILRNNPQASGFNVTSIKAGGNDLPSTDSLWNNRCIFELYSPASLQDLEERPFFEIGESYKVIKDTSGDTPVITHQYNPMVLSDGDVYFRRHAVNLPLLSDGAYQSIINVEAASTPSFFNYYLESSTFNDNIIGADQHDYGRIKAVVPNASEIRRYASVIFSDQDDYSDTQLRLNSFDATKMPFKDLPNTYGNIGCILDYNDSLFVLQQTKVSQIPVNRTILSDVSGNDAIIATSEVLGNQRYYAGENGCDTNPESVAVVGNTIYWANKKKSKVYKFNPANGVTAISDIGMKSYFKKLFDALDVVNKASGGRIRVVGGYDPTHDEYVLSAFDQSFIDFTADVIPDIPEGEPEEDDFVDETVNTVGDLSADEEAALAALAAFVQTKNEELLAEVAELEQQIADLLLQINTEVEANDGIVPTSIIELNQAVVEANEEASNLVTVIEEGIQSQVADHETTLSIANATREQAELLLNNLQFFDGSFQAGSQYESIANSPVTFLGVDYETGTQAMNALQGKAVSVATFAAQYNEATQNEEVRDGQLITFTIGFGAGPNPDPNSFIGENGQQAYIDKRSEIVQLRQGIASFGAQEVIQILRDDFDTVVADNTVLQAQRGELLSQIYSIASGIETSRVPDVDVDDPNLIPTSVDEFTVTNTRELGEGLDDSDFSDNINVIKRITDTGGDEDELEALFFSEAGDFIGLAPGAIREYISAATNINLNQPHTARRLIDYNQIEPLTITRDSFALAFVNVLQEQNDNVDDLFNALTELYGIDASVAAQLISISTGEEVVDLFDEDEDGLVTSSDITTVFPIGAFGDALGTAIDNQTAPTPPDTVLQDGVWETDAQFRQVFGDLIDDILDVGEQVGLRAEGDALGNLAINTEQTGFSLVGIGDIDALRQIVNDPRWAEGDSAFIKDAVNTVRRRIVDDDQNNATISKIVDIVEDKFTEINTRPAQEGFRNNPSFIFTDEIAQNAWASRFRFNGPSPVWSESWHNTVANMKQDLDDVLQALKDFQNVTASIDKDDVNVEGLGTQIGGQAPEGDEPKPLTFDTPLSLQAQNRVATGFDGPNAADLITGQNFTATSTDALDPNPKLEVHSAFYGLSAAIDRANDRISTLLDTSSAALQTYNIRVSNLEGESRLSSGTADSIRDAEGVDQAPIRAIFSNDTDTNIGNTFDSLTADQIALRVSNSLNPESDFFNIDFANSVRDNFIIPAQATGNIAASQGDIDGDGAVAVPDLLALLATFGTSGIPQPPNFSALDFAGIIQDLYRDDTAEEPESLTELINENDLFEDVTATPYTSTT